MVNPTLKTMLTAIQKRQPLPNGRLPRILHLEHCVFHDRLQVGQGPETTWKVIGCVSLAGFVAGLERLRRLTRGGTMTVGGCRPAGVSGAKERVWLPAQRTWRTG